MNSCIFHEVLAAVFQDRKRSTVKNYRCALENYALSQGQGLDAILRASPLSVSRWRRFNAGRIAETTQSLYWVCLRTLWDFLATSGEFPELKDNPWKSAVVGRRPSQKNGPKPTNTIPEAISIGEFLATLPRENWKQRRDHMAISLLFLCGLRAAEVCALDVEHVYVEPSGRILLYLHNTKTSKLEAQVVPRSLAPDLVHWAQKIYQRGDRTTPLFPSASLNGQEQGSSRLQYSVLFRAVKAHQKRLGVRLRIGTHSGRATVATRLLVTGTPLASAAKFLRHKDPATTLRYCKADRAIQEAVADDVDAIR